MFELKHHISDDNEDIHDYIISLDSDYDWNTAVKWADEMAESDIFSVTNLYTSASIGAPKKIMLAEYKANDKSIKSMKSLKEEQGVIERTYSQGRRDLYQHLLGGERTGATVLF